MGFWKFELYRFMHVRKIILVLGVLNVVLLAVAVAVAVLSTSFGCPQNITAAMSLVAAGSGGRTLWMWMTGFIQVATASTMLAEESAPAVSPIVAGTRQKRRHRYIRWIWWSRCGHLITALQVAAVAYCTYVTAKTASYNSAVFIKHCSGDIDPGETWLRALVMIVPLAGWILVISQCCAGSNTLTWRSLYNRRAEAWRAHYREVFDYGIREVLCCLGRSQYLDVLENEEVDAVAALLGDLVAYRAEGPGHLEFLAGVALLREQTPKAPVPEDIPDAPANLLIDATRLHPYAVAAYTGPLLDVGRHRATFLCAWLYRQGIFTAWNRNKRPKLEGDNWWRGHAAAFLRHVKLPGSALRKGRVCQTNREAVYFVVVVDELRSVVVAVRGTETPEDLITDGLGKECPLSNSDLQGLLESPQVPDCLKQEIASSRRFGHIGVVHAARELAEQLDGFMGDVEYNDVRKDGNETNISAKETDVHRYRQRGLLSALLGPDGECSGYALRFVGHSLGGAIASLTALRLYKRFPSLRVYAYGVLPCVDAVTAKACSSFTSSIIYNDEFSSRLSVAAITKLREKALDKLKAVNTDSAVIMKLWRCWGSQNLETLQQMPALQESAFTSRNASPQHFRRRFSYSVKGGVCLCSHACRCIWFMSKKCLVAKSDAKLGDDLPKSDPVMAEPIEVVEANCPLHPPEHKFAGNGGSTPSFDRFGLGASGEQISRPCMCANNGYLHSRGSDEGARFLNAGSDSLVSDEEAQGFLALDINRQNSGAENTDGDAASVTRWVDPQVREEPQCAESVVDISIDAANEAFEPVEMFVPGLVVHVTCDDEVSIIPWPILGLSKRRNRQRKHQHRAILRDRTYFRDIVVSPTMFLDHLPWKCQHALNDIVAQLGPRTMDESDLASKVRCIRDNSEIV